MVDASPEDADVVVVNTCSVTATADQGARQTIRRIVRSNPSVKVIVTGCYATRRPGEINELPNVVRVVSNPEKETLVDAMDCGDALVDCAARSARIAPHFHLPLQHGSDEMLAAMNRPYTSAFYRDLVERIHSRIPDAAIGTDLIAGFPGETDRHFDEMRALVESLPLTYLHVFPYSDRPGTAASRMRNKVDGNAIRSRARAL